MSLFKNIAIIGGAGQVALHLTKILASQGRTVTSVIRNPKQTPIIEQAGGKAKVLSLEQASVADFASFLEGKDVVVFSAGAGGGGPERTKAVDFEGAVKIFDAIEKTQSKPRLILVSSIDVRDRNKPWPAHYNEDDKRASEFIYRVLTTYIYYKFLADKELITRTAFKWTILRPGQLIDDATPATGHASIGVTHIHPAITREDVARGLALLVDRPDAAGLAISMVGVAEENRSSSTEIPHALDAAIKRGETDFEG